MKALSAFLSVICGSMWLAMSCSVHENRSECPCYLNFAHKGFDPGMYSGNLAVVAFEGKKVSEGSYELSRLMNGSDEIPVPKGRVSIGCIGGVSRNEIRDSLLIIPLGIDCDPIFAFGSSASAYGEIALVYGRVRKQHAKLKIEMNNFVEGEYPFFVKIVGNVSGMNLLDNKPICGAFLSVPDEAEAGVFNLNIPRQLDASLLLEIIDKSDSAIVVERIALGRLLNDEIKYDWTAPDLADIKVFIDYAKSEISITVTGWELGGTFKMKI